jgi:hypothetical protein
MVTTLSLFSAKFFKCEIYLMYSCGPESGPGAWTTPGKLFTPGLPAVDKYKPEYYRLDTLSCGRGILPFPRFLGGSDKDPKES